MADIDPDSLNVILATDCGSTTTKAILFEKKSDRWRQTFRGEAPTTVEAPFDDVTLGVVNAVTEVQELSGRRLLDGGRILTPASGETGTDLYVSTSSAGGGLQMMVTGIVRTMTAESAERAALGAGAIVMDVISMDDGRKTHERITRIRHLRPDIVLLAGGVDGGAASHAVELAETLLAADPRPRFGRTLTLPVIYAGNQDVSGEVEKLLGEKMALRVVENIRPVLERENLGPARAAIHDVFLEHVMSHAPGYDKLLSWSPVPIMSTPAAVGDMVRTFARERDMQVLAVDIGGATTDIFSVFAGTFNRTVSANLGMSYSVSNVLLEAGIENIIRWVPLPLVADEVREQLRNKMIRPTTIPQTVEDLLVEQAVAREALRLAFDHHKALATGLKGVQQERTLADAFSQTASGDTIVDMMGLDMIIGSGGVLSHAPSRKQAALMMLDAFAPEGFTRLAVDSIFMMPHLGVMSSVHGNAAAEIFENDCIVDLGTAVAPVGRARKPGEPMATVTVNGASHFLAFGEFKVLPLADGETAEVTVRPERRFDVGAGRGADVTRTVVGGAAGLILDGRGRPLTLPADAGERVARLKTWLGALGLAAGKS